MSGIQICLLWSLSTARITRKTGGLVHELHTGHCCVSAGKASQGKGHSQSLQPGDYSCGLASFGDASGCAERLTLAWVHLPTPFWKQPSGCDEHCWRFCSGSLKRQTRWFCCFLSEIIYWSLPPLELHKSNSELFEWASDGAFRVLQILLGRLSV